MPDWSRVPIAEMQQQQQQQQQQQPQYGGVVELQQLFMARSLGVGGVGGGGGGSHFLGISREAAASAMSPPPPHHHFQQHSRMIESLNNLQPLQHLQHLHAAAAHNNPPQQQLHHRQQPNAIGSNENSPEAPSPSSRLPPNGFKHLLVSREPAVATTTQGAARTHQQGEDEDDEEGERSSGGGRWPSEETRALIKIRVDMDSSFRNSSPKAPLWEEVSRKLSAMGYMRNAKKCKEKFENISKYYRKTKEGKGSRLDGKNYRYFEELEALYGSNSALTGGALCDFQKDASAGHLLLQGIASIRDADGASSEQRDVDNNSYDVNSSSESSAEYDEPGEFDQEHENAKKGKRKSWKSRMAFFENLVKRFVEKQEAMQHKFLEVLEKREQDRIKREETWRKQEVARLNREYELRVEEHARRVSYDAALAAALQKATGQMLELPHGPVPSPYSNPLATEVNEDQQKEGYDSTNKRWPRAEVQALIQLRAAMEPRFQEVGPKGPFWEEISAALACQGYVRSAKRCKEKWENINKYYRKTSCKKRPENTKTCPYFQMLDALYQKGMVGTPSCKSGQHKLEETTDELEESNKDDSSHAQGGEAEVLSIAEGATPSNGVTTTTGLFSSPENCATNTDGRLQSRGGQKRNWIDGGTGNGSLGLSFDALQGGGELFCGSSNKTLKFDGFAKDVLEAQRQQQRLVGDYDERRDHQHLMIQERQSQEFQEAESSATRGCNLEGFGIGGLGSRR